MAHKDDIRPGMQVLGSDGGMVGRVTGLHGDHIHIEPDAPQPSPGDRMIPNKWVARVDEHVHLDREAALVRETWGTEESVTAKGPVRRGAASDRNGSSKIVWIIGALLLLLVIALGIWGFVYAADDPEYESAPVAAAPAPAATGADVPGGALGVEIEAYLASDEAAPRTFVLEDLRFDEGGAEIRSSDRGDLAAIGRIIAARPDSRVRVTGYGDQGEGNGFSLGERRAEAVAAALVANGVRPANIETAAGETGGRPPEITILSR